jgi:hypothetical protein
MIDSIGGTSPFAGAQDSASGGLRQAIMNSASTALGLSVQDLRSALDSGQSLADVAQQRGVSRDDLVSAVAQGIQSAPPTGAPAPAAATELAQHVVDRHHGHHHHRHHVDPAQDGAQAPAGTPAPGDSSQGTMIDTVA